MFKEGFAEMEAQKTTETAAASAKTLAPIESDEARDVVLDDVAVEAPHGGGEMDPRH